MCLFNGRNCLISQQNNRRNSHWNQWYWVEWKTIAREKKWEEIQKIIPSNEAVAKKVLYQQIFKKLQQSQIQTYTNCESKKKKFWRTGNAESHTYAEVTQAGRNPTMRLSKINKIDKNQKQNIHEKLHSISPTKQLRKQGNNLGRKPSKQTQQSTIHSNRRQMKSKKKLISWSINK